MRGGWHRRDGQGCGGAGNTLGMEMVAPREEGTLRGLGEWLGWSWKQHWSGPSWGVGSGCQDQVGFFWQPLPMQHLPASVEWLVLTAASLSLESLQEWGVAEVSCSPPAWGGSWNLSAHISSSLVSQ